MLLNTALARPYNNLGVPGATTLDFLRAYNAATSQSPGNPFFNFVLRGELFQNATMLRQAIQLNPKVMTLWIGSNDILGGITAGTVIEGVTVTPVAVYSALMDLGLDTLLNETKAHIFMANIPGVTTIPFVTTVAQGGHRRRFPAGPHQWIPRSPPDPGKRRGVRPLSGPGGVPAGHRHSRRPRRHRATPAGQPDPDPGRGGNRQPPHRRVQRLPPAEGPGPCLPHHLGGREPAPDRLEGRTDPRTHPASIRSSIPSGSAFSLDGIHPNTKGYIQVANLFIEAINRALHKKYRKVPDGSCGTVAAVL